MSIRKLFLITSFSFFWSGCASINKQPALEHWENFNSISTGLPGNILNDQVPVVFIREKNAFSGPAVNVFVEGEYLTSLQAGGYKTIPLCAMPTNITAEFTNVDKNYLDLRERKNSFNLEKDKTYYFLVRQDSRKQIYLEPLNIEQAQQVMQNVKEQVNTLSRLQKNSICPKVIYQPVSTQQPKIKKYTLAASALFAYSKSGSTDVLNQGRNEIEVIADEIKKNESQIGHIAVIGYTDPVGSNAFNQQLSLKRAETVRDLMVSRGLAKQNILVEGRGELDLVASECERDFPVNKLARDKCNEPNRRVEIVTYGLKAQ